MDEGMSECPDCEGSGIAECGYCGQETDCEACEGTGEVEDN